MTQQNESGQRTTGQRTTGPGTATDQPLPADAPVPTGEPASLEQPPPLPSPYLDATGSPQAYLAPPRPDQPRYGSPTGYRPGPRSFGPGQQGYGRPGYTDQGYGRPSNARGGFGARSRRDPAIAAPWERLFASILDWVIIFVVSVLAFLSPLEQIARDWQDIGARYPNPYSPAAQAAFATIQKDPATHHTILYWLLGMFGIALAYYWVQHAAWGATIGKRLFGMRVVTTDRSPIGVWAAGLRAAAFLVGPAVCMLATLLLLLSILGELLWLADTGIVVFDSRAQCLHDKVAGTIVVRQRWLDQQARSARP